VFQHRALACQPALYPLHHLQSERCTLRHRGCRLVDLVGMRCHQCCRRNLDAINAQQAIEQRHRTGWPFLGAAVSRSFDNAVIGVKCTGACAPVTFTGIHGCGIWDAVTRDRLQPGTLGVEAGCVLPAGSGLKKGDAHFSLRCCRSVTNPKMLGGILSQAFRPDPATNFNNCATICLDKVTRTHSVWQAEIRNFVRFAFSCRRALLTTPLSPALAIGSAHAPVRTAALHHDAHSAATSR
jgi:hypothetical protein